MQPTNLNLKAIARDAALRGDTKTLFHTLDLLERLLPIAAFMDFCTELEELRLQGRSSTNKSAGAVPLCVDRFEQVFIEIRSSDVRDSTCDSTAGSGYTGRGRLLLPHVPQSVSGHLDQDIRAPA
jgi:hypothetical protein